MQQPQGNFQNSVPPQQPVRVVSTLRLRKFKWEIVVPPLALLAGIYVLNHATAVVRFEDVMDWLHVHDRVRYRELGSFALIATAICWIAKIARKD